MMKSIILKASFAFLVLWVGSTVSLTAQAPYKGAIGFRTGYYGNLGIDAKFFVGEKAAIEVVATTRGYNSYYSYRYNEIMGLYQIQKPLKLPESNIEGFSWYVGGGGSLGFYSESYATNTISLAGVVGLEYTLPKTPLTFSLDWMPRYFLSSNIYWSGFASNSGGARVAYYFGGKN
ncbi:MAG: hypothetical protein JNL70_13960 [Saprospiraceae bacterium]|nr:hypothetical protein [Saprospiraceae bacterium]